MATYRIRPATEGPWLDAGDSIEDAMAALAQLGRDRAPTTARTLVWVRNDFNGSTTVFEVDALGHVTNHGPYDRFYGRTT